MISGTLLLFPKYSAYENKHTIDKKNIKRVVDEKLATLLKYSTLMAIIMEDKLAVELTTSLKPQLVTVLKPIYQLQFLESKDVPIGYLSSEKGILCNRDYLQAAETKYKMTLKMREESSDEIELRIKMLSLIQKRIRFVSSMVAENDSKSLLVFQKNNHMFCDIPKPRDYDCKIIQICDIYTGLSKYYYSGFPVSEEDYYKILEEVIV